VHELLTEDTDTSSATLLRSKKVTTTPTIRGRPQSFGMDILDVPSPLEPLRANADAETGMTT